MSAFNPVAANDLIEKHRITYLFSVPTLYQAMVSAPNYNPEKMAALDRIDREWPATVRHIYGTTEIMCALYNPEPVGRPVTLRPGYYSRVRLVRVGHTENDLVKPGEASESTLEGIRRPLVRVERDIAIIPDRKQLDLHRMGQEPMRDAGRRSDQENIRVVWDELVI